MNSPGKPIRIPLSYADIKDITDRHLEDNPMIDLTEIDSVTRDFYVLPMVAIMFRPTPLVYFKKGAEGKMIIDKPKYHRAVRKWHMQYYETLEKMRKDRQPRSLILDPFYFRWLPVMFRRL